jgi:trehalose 6-phosphate phosphatase
LTSALDRLRARPDVTGILLDFDGSLSDIVEHPGEARPAPGARDVLGDLTARYRVVAVISGRRSAELPDLVGVPGVRYEGLYGLEEDDALPGEARARVEDVARLLAGVRVEAKGPTLAVHYREVADPDHARDVLHEKLGAIAERSSLELTQGKMVFELVPAGARRKGGAIERLVREESLQAALYAGDDLPDLEAFAVLDRLRDAGILAVKVAVGGAETPQDLLQAADIVVDHPAGLVELLRSL